jgi:hypothetical protein
MVRIWWYVSILAVMQLWSCAPRLSQRDASWNQSTGVFGWAGGKVTLPAGFRYREDRGTDSFEGHFTSADGKIIVRHDIGGYAGARANRREAVTFEERVNNARAPDRATKWPDGSGGTTSARRHLPDNGCANFINVDNVADAGPIQRIAQSFRPRGKSDGGPLCVLDR